MAGVTNADTQLKINIILNAFSLACAFGGTVYADKLGRRWMGILSTSVATVFLFLVGGFSALYGDGKNVSGSYSTVAMMFLFMGAYSAGWTPLTILYPVEVCLRASSPRWRSTNKSSGAQLLHESNRNGTVHVRMKSLRFRTNLTMP